MDPDIRASPSAQTHTYSKTGGTGNLIYGVYNNPSTVALFGSSSPAPGVANGASIVLIGVLDFENQASYTLNLRATDGGFQQPFGLFAANTLTIEVRDVNESPSLTNLEASRSVAECVSPGCSNTEIAADGRATVGAVLTTSDLDTDTWSSGGHADFGWTSSSHKFSLAPADSNRIGDSQTSFTIGESNGQIAAALNANLDFEARGRITLHVEVTDQNINGGWSSPIKVEGDLFVTLTNINEQPVTDSVGPFYFKKDSAIGTEVGTLTATDPDFGVAESCCSNYRFNYVSATITGQDQSNAAKSDLSLNAVTGLFTVARNNIDTTALTPTVYQLTITVDDLATDTSGSYSKLTSDAVVVTIEVINENNKPVITGKSSGATLNIDENSVAGTAIIGGTIQCTDREVDIICTTTKDTDCSTAGPNEAACDGQNECEWQSGTCACRRQMLEFFAILNTPKSVTAEGDPLPIVFGFKSGSGSDQTVYYDNGASPTTGDPVQATLYLRESAAYLIDFETYKTLDVTYGCRDTGFRVGATSNDPPVGWMESVGVASSIQQVTITINDVNEPPFFTTGLGSSGKFELEVDEMSDLLAMTENFGSHLTCRDLDAAASGSGDTTNDVTLTLKTAAGATSTNFQIVQDTCTPGANIGGTNCPSNGIRPWCTGAVIKPIGTISGGGWLPDFETQQIYDFIVTASDQGGLTHDLPVRITVRDKNDRPLIARHSTSNSNAWSVSEDAPTAFVVGRFVVSDPDIDGLVVTWRESSAPWDVLEVTIESGNTGSAFELVVVSGTGTIADPTVVELRYRGQMAPYPGAAEYGLDFERQKQYTIVFRVTDSGGPQTVTSTPALPDATNPLRPAFTKSPLSAEITQIINIFDVDDVTIEDILVTGSSMLSTAGGNQVRIVGTNFGATWEGSTDPTIVVTYTNPLAPTDASANDPTSAAATGSAGISTVFTAENCVRDNDVTTVTTFVTNTAIVCSSAAGFGNNQVWTVTISGNSVGSTTSVIETSYNYPVIESVSISDSAVTMSTVGGESVLLTGTNMGPIGTQYWGDFGPTRLGGYGYCAGRTTGTGTWCTTTTANTQVTCSTAAGVGTSHSWRLQERKHASWKTQDHSAITKTSGTGTLDYTAPVINQLIIPEKATESGGLRTQGGEDILLIGSGYGSPNTNLYPCGKESLSPNGNVYPPAGPQHPVARYGATGVEYPRRAGSNTECSDSTTSGCGAVCSVQSDVQMTCNTEPAVGALHTWTVLVAGQTSIPSTGTTNHRRPVFSVISGAGLKGGGTEGGTTVNIIGDQFGPIPPRTSSGDYSYLIEANYGHWDTTTGTWNTQLVPIFSSNCIMITAHTSLQCITSAGIGKNLSWTVTVHARTVQTSLPNHAEGSYAPPSLFTLSGNSGNDVQRGGTVGGNHIIIQGKNFGPKGKAWNVPQLSYGKDVGIGVTPQKFYAANCMVTKEHVTIECDTAEGAGFSHLWEVLVGGQLNTPATTGYAQPEIFNITGPGSTMGDSSGNQWVYLEGKDFGPPSSGLTLSGPSFLESVTYGVTGREYTAKDCVVISHDLIKCRTVSGVGTRNLWQIRIAGQINDVSKSPITDYAPPRCWAILDVAATTVAVESRQSWITNPQISTDRIELRCEHTGLADSLASSRYVRYSLGGYERHIALDVANTRRVGTPGIAGTYEQLRFINPPLEWINTPAASVPTTVVLTTASGEILETTALQHTYAAPEIQTEPTVTAGIAGLASTFNVSLAGRNFGERGEVLRYDGSCNETKGEVCSTGLIRRCMGGNIAADTIILCEWNIVPGVHQKFNPHIGGVFQYSHTNVELTFKGLRGIVIIRRGGRLSALRKSEKNGDPQPPEWSNLGYDWSTKQGCTIPRRPAAGYQSMNKSNVGAVTDPGIIGSSGSSDWTSTECDMGQASNNASFNALSPYITSMEGIVTLLDSSGNVVGTNTDLNFPTVGHKSDSQQAKLVVKCWYCKTQTAQIWIGGESIDGNIVGGRRCLFDATLPGLDDPEYANQPDKLAAVYTCAMPNGQGYEQPVWVLTDSGPSGLKGGFDGQVKNVIHYKPPTIATYTSSYTCSDLSKADLCATTKGGSTVTLRGSNFGDPGHAQACTYGIVMGELKERCWLTTSVSADHNQATFNIPTGIGGDWQAIYLRVVDQNSGVPGTQLPNSDLKKTAPTTLTSPPSSQQIRYTQGVVVGSLMPPRRDPTGGYDVEIFGYDFADAAAGTISVGDHTKVWFGDVPCLVKLSKFDRILCTMQDSSKSTGSGTTIQVWVGPGNAPGDVPSVQQCRNASPQEKLNVVNEQTGVRDIQLYGAVSALQSAEIALVQQVVGRTGGLAAALIAADSLEALIASEKPGNIVSSLQIAVLAQEEGRYLDTGGNWIDVTPEQLQNADAAWATRGAALAEADKKADSFQERLLMSSKHVDANTLAAYKAAGVGSDPWINKIIETDLANPTKTPTHVLMLSAQNYGRVTNVGDKIIETSTITTPLSSTESSAENTAAIVGRLEDAQSDAEAEEQEKSLTESTAADTQALDNGWGDAGECFGNLTCSTLRLKLKKPDPPREDDLQTVAQSTECVDTDQDMGGAKKFPVDSEWDIILDRVRSGTVEDGSKDYFEVANFCTENTKILERKLIDQQSKSEVDAARTAAEAGTATGAQLQMFIPGFFQLPYSNPSVSNVNNLGAGANAADIAAVNALTKTTGTSTKDFVNSNLGSTLKSEQTASNCAPLSGAVLTPAQVQGCQAQIASNPCYPDDCTKSSKPDIRGVYIHVFNSTLNLTQRLANNIPTNALTINSDGRTTTHRLLVEVRGTNFGSDESKLNLSFVSNTNGPAKSIPVPYNDVLTTDEVMAASINSDLHQYSADRNQDGERDGFGSITSAAGERVFFWCPPGQGKDLVLRIIRRIASGSELASVPSLRAAISYSTPVIALTGSQGGKGVYTESPYRYAPTNSGPTDGCTTGSWESLLQWAARIEGIPDATRLQNPQVYGRRCTKWHTVVIEGENFGANPSLLTVNAVIGDRTYPLHDGPKIYLSCDDRCGEWVENPPTHRYSFYNPNCGSRKYFVPQMEFSHTKLVLCAPLGYGKDLQITVDVAGQSGLQAVPASWDFEQPELTETFPNPFNGLGTETAVTLNLAKEQTGGTVTRTPRTIEIRGNNFGAVENVPKVIINGKLCETPAWHAEHPVDGFPYITCDIQPNVVGAVNMSFLVADQWSKTVDVIQNIRRAPIRSECISSVTKDDGTVDHYWGRLGELCTSCSKGEICVPSTYQAPYAMPGFWMDVLDISGPTALEQYPEATDLDAGGKILTADESNDMLMANGQYDSNVQRKCPPERLLDPIIDQKIISEFPLALVTKKDTCQFTAACMPSEACNGSQTCHPNYEGKRLRCEAWQEIKLQDVPVAERNTTNHFPCNHTLQCRNRGFGDAGARCGQAIATVCNCPSDWISSSQGSSMSCLKACLRTPSKLEQLLAAGCRSGEQLGRSLTGADCGGTSPEECSVCMPNTPDAITGEVTGTCSCQASKRCVWCTYSTHYRMEGKCEKCPENPELVIAGLITAMVVCCIGTYLLDKRDFNLAFISIGVDYFQVLALFASADVRWPAALKYLFRLLSFFNFNLDIAAPECLLPEFKYEWKFYGTLLLPLACGILFLGSTICKHVSDRYIMQRTKRDKYYLSKMIGTFMLLMYYLYLMTARKALEVFNCNPSEPDDGFLYTQFADEECDGGMCRCNDPNHIQVRLIFPATVALFVYTLGYPVLVYVILRQNKHLVKEDQLLRTLNTGDTPSTNKNAYHMRRRYHKLYYHFKPGKWYWIVLIVARKAGIVVAGLMFRVNPGFQLSLILLVLFTAYVFQVKHQPYMSTAQRKEVILDHQEKARNGHPVHMALAARIKEAVTESRGGGNSNIKRTKQYTLGSSNNLHEEAAKQQKIKDSHKKKREYFWDYNTVEQVLLSCGIFVCLSGVMFESDRFSEEGSGNEPGKNSFEWQREIIVYAVMTVVIFSFVFYFSVFLSEAMGITPSWVKKCFAKKHKTHLDKLIAMGGEDANSNEVTLEMNPMQRKMAEEKAAQKATIASAQKLMEMEEEVERNREMHQQQLNHAKKQVARAANSGAAIRKRGAKKKKKGRAGRLKNKKEIGQTGIMSQKEETAAETAAEINLSIKDAEFGVAFSPKDLMTNSPKKKDQEAKTTEQAKKKKKQKQKRKSFVMHKQDDGDNYFEDVESGETTWSMPEDGELLVSKSGSDVMGNERVWQATADEATGNTYYHNVMDNSVSWEKPPENQII